jgi:hypothetical protein
MPHVRRRRVPTPAWRRRQHQSGHRTHGESPALAPTCRRQIHPARRKSRCSVLFHPSFVFRPAPAVLSPAALLGTATRSHRSRSSVLAALGRPRPLNATVTSSGSLPRARRASAVPRYPNSATLPRAGARARARAPAVDAALAPLLPLALASDAGDKDGARWDFEPVLLRKRLEARAAREANHSMRVRRASFPTPCPGRTLIMTLVVAKELTGDAHARGAREPQPG